MIDPISLSVAVGAVVVAILTHLKFSKCFGIEIETRKLSREDSLNEQRPLLKK